MAYDERLAGRIRKLFEGRTDVVERRMFGGLAFLLRGNMCVGVMKDVLFARVGPMAYSDALTKPHARKMDFTGRPMNGYLYVDPDGIRSARDLRRWVEMCEAFVRTLPAKEAKK